MCVDGIAVILSGTFSTHEVVRAHMNVCRYTCLRAHVRGSTCMCPARGMSEVARLPRHFLLYQNEHHKALQTVPRTPKSDLLSVKPRSLEALCIQYNFAFFKL